MKIILDYLYKTLQILLLIPFLSIPAQSQNTKEIGAELTKKYAAEMNMTVSNPMYMNGRDVWILSIPEGFTFDYLKEKADKVSKELNIEVLSDWKKNGNLLVYGFEYEKQAFALAYNPENRILMSMVVPPEPTKNTNSTGEWKTIHTFTGSGIKKTAPFTVNSNEWKVIFESKANMYSPDGAGHLFQLFLLKPGQEMFEGEIVVNEANKKNIRGESYVYKSGRFYFNSVSANGDWTIKVQVRD